MGDIWQYMLLGAW